MRRSKLITPEVTMHVNHLIVQKGGGMNDRLCYLTQRYVDEPILVSGKRVFQISNDSDDIHQERRKVRCNVDVREHEPVIGTVVCDAQIQSTTLHGSYSYYKQDLCISNKEMVPEGMPLSKPPLLLTSLHVGKLDGSLKRIDLSNNDECVEDESSTSSTATTVSMCSSRCNSKIYKSIDGESPQSSTMRDKWLLKMNPDEILFLEAASALSSGRGKPMTVGTNPLQSQQPRFETSTGSFLKQSLGKKDKTATSIPNITKKNFISNPTQKKRPLGPPPFVLRHIRKTVGVIR